MNINFLRKSVLSLSLATVALFSGSLSVSAQPAEKNSSEQFSQSNQISPEQQNTGVGHFSSSFSNETAEKSNISVNPELVTPELLASETVTQKVEKSTPVPGTSSTSSASLATQHPSSDAQYSQAQLSQSISSDLAQADIDFGGSTRGGSSYIGVAGNLGLGGDSALGDGNFMIISKVGVTDILSIRPSVVLGDDTVILVPVTYDFSFESSDPFSEALPFSPYVGAGVALATGDDSEFSFLVTGGVDVPLNDKFTATAAINAAFFDETDLGVSVGVGYNFGGF
ncbi:MAG: hypothetical protein SWZ49_16720 [Cyanobacteriota bacterium]|nr:hypothetical protein [Cyanobacteriota bacterium]